ncbi:MAG: glutathione peroxidase [Prevotella sp.]|jgi:glutathione peroxidase|nr:glutathione peroxidase [Prevotella sp.]
MKKYLFLLLLSAAAPTLFSQMSLYDFKVQDIDGKVFDMASLKGKKVLIVNVASKCGLTPQYEELQKLYTMYGGEDFTVIAFPANDFKGQEPGSNEEIKEFCISKYGVTFPVMGKISVLGDEKAPIYKWLTEKELNGKFDAKVQWNFQKFLIGRDGRLVDFALPKEKPLSKKIISWILEE